MDNILQILASFTTEYPATTSYILGGAILLQGDLAVLFAVALVVGGAISWGKYFGVLLGTLAAAELLLYLGGRLIRNTRFGWRWYMKTRTNRRVQYYSYYITQNLTKLMIAARFLVGVNFLVLLLAGWSRTKFGPFLKSYLVGLLTWFVCITGVAYSLVTGLSYLRTEHVFRQVEIGVGVAIVLFIIGEFFVKKVLEKRISRTDEERVREFAEREMQPPER